jgi:iron complex outermembrane receptor protein
MHRHSLFQLGLVAAALALGVPIARADDASGIEDVRAPSSKAPRLTDPSVAGSVVDEKRLGAAGARTAELLREQPGVAVTDTGGYGALATATVRGATSAQTPVYLGGIRLNDDVGGTADLSLTPPWLLRRIEIYRGNAPLRADRLGIGGAIFLEPRVPRRTEAGAGALLGSFGAAGGFAWAGVGDRRAAALVGVRWEQARNDYPYLDDRGTAFEPSDDRTLRRTNADASTVDAWALGRAYVDAAQIDLLANVVAREQGVPGIGLLPTLAVRSRVERELGGVTVKGRCAREDRCSIASTSSFLASRTTTTDPLGELFPGSPVVTFLGSRLEEALTLRLDLSPRVTATFVARGGLERLSVRGAGPEVGGTRVRGAPAALVEWAPGALLVLRGLALVDLEGTSADAGSTFRALPSLRVGAQVGHGALVGLANLGRYARSPTLGELYGVTGAQRGNPTLAAEGGWTADVGGRWASAPSPVAEVRAEAFVFARLADDLIAYRRSSFGYLTPYNVGAARVLGAELALAALFLRRIEATAALSLLDPRDTGPERTTTNDLLPFRSRLVFAPRVTVHSGRLARVGVDDASFGVGFLWQSGRVADPAGLVAIPAQGALDLEAGIAFRATQLRLRVANVTDAPRFDVVGYPLPGRSAYLSLEVHTP